MFSFSCSAACATATSEARHPKAQGFSAHAGRLARPLVARSAPWSPGGVISSKRWALRFSFAAWLGVTACFTLPASLARATEPSGPAALTKATQLAAKAAQLRDEGKWDDAIPIAEEVVRLRDANAPANAVSRADAYTALAYLLRANRQRDRAVDVAKKAVAARELSEPGSQHLASDLLALAWALQENGERASTEEPQRRALALLEASPTSNVVELLRAAEGVVSFELDRFTTSHDATRLAEAEGVARRAIRAMERAPAESLERVQAQVLLGSVLVWKGDERCEDILQRASNALEARTDSAARQSRAGTLELLGSFLIGKQRFRDGAAALRQAFALSSSSLGATHPHTIATAASLAGALSRTGESAEALAVAEEALRRARPNTGHYRCDVGLERDIGLRATVATARRDLGDYKGALAVLEDGLALVEQGRACTIIRGLPGVAGSSSSSTSKQVDNVKDHPLALVQALVELGGIQTQMSMHGTPTDAALAEARFRRAIGIAEASGPGAATFLAAARGDLALLLWKPADNPATTRRLAKAATRRVCLRGWSTRALVGSPLRSSLW